MISRQVEGSQGPLAILAAVRFAAAMHRDQRRKGVDASPYINHPIDVAEILARIGGVTDPCVLQAAILHDTIEDTSASEADLEGRFGVEVAGLVREVTDDKELPKAERKRLQAERAPQLSVGAKLIKLGDKICNVRDVTESPPKDWSLERRREYLESSRRVVGGCRGVNAALERCFDELYSAGVKRLDEASGAMGAPSAGSLPDAALVVYGSTASYYTGKLEAYFRAKGIAYRPEPFSESNMRRCARHTGVLQIPQVECPDGSWLVDTTLIIEHFERVRPEPAVTPRDPALAFVSRLIEDYADEWLWRPAMHYRWSFPETARLMSVWLAEHLAERRAPQWLKRRYWRHRQYGAFVRGDGVDDGTRAAVESSYLETLAVLESAFARRPYLLGERPTEADFRFFGPLFRHFFSDPAPARIMWERAPAVQEWVARMWNLRPDRFESAPLPVRLPKDLSALLGTIARVYLPYLDANASAYARGEKVVRYEAQGARFREPMKPYRVWCRDRLQAQLDGLDEAARSAVERALGSREAVARLVTPSPRRAENVVASLPVAAPSRAKAVDSWWRE